MSSGWRTHHIFMPRSTGGTILGERLLFNMLRVVSSGFLRRPGCERVFEEPVYGADHFST